MSSVWRVRSRVAVFICLVTLFAGLFATGNCQSQKPQGLSNFGQVTQNLYRGAHPSESGFRALRHMGVTIIVNFRNDQEATREKHTVEALGMKYIEMPWSGWRKPSTSQVVQFLDLVRDNPHAIIFVHCQRGADRTGTMIAAYRIVVEHDSTSDAVAEMLRYHYAHFWLPQLQRYVVSLPRLQQTDTLLTTYATGLPVAPKPAIASIVPVTP